MEQPISIIIPAYNQLDYCRRCVASVRAHTHRAYKLILVDNGSTDGVGAYFDGVPGALVLHVQDNLGFAAGVNLGIAEAEGHVVLLNSDTQAPEGWLARLEAALLTSDDIGIVGPMTNSAPGLQQIDGLERDSIDAVNAFARDLAERNAGKIRDAYRLVGFCMLIREEVWRTIGLFDERFGLGTFEDGDYCLRVMQAGYRLCVAEDCFVYHYGGRTFAGMGLTGEKLDALAIENERRLLEKWGRRALDLSEAALESKDLNERARDALARGVPVEAMGLLKEAIRAFPMLETNYNDLGAILWGLGERGPAFDYFVRAVCRNPHYEEGVANLMEAAAALGRTTEAERILEDAVAHPRPITVRHKNGKD